MEDCMGIIVMTILPPLSFYISPVTVAKVSLIEFSKTRQFFIQSKWPNFNVLVRRHALCISSTVTNYIHTYQPNKLFISPLKCLHNNEQ